MTNEAMKDLFDRWERAVYSTDPELAKTCLAPIYTRHGSAIQTEFTRAYTAEEYARVVTDQPRLFTDQRWDIGESAFVEDRAWLRGTMHRTHPDGRHETRAYLQTYRVENGRLAETWVALNADGTAWPEADAQEHWTSTRPLLDEPTTRALIQDWFQVLNHDRFDLGRTCLADPYVRHSEQPGAITSAAGHGALETRSFDADEYIEQLKSLRQRFPDNHYEIHAATIVGDKAWLRGTTRRTDSPTGKIVTRAFLQVYRVQGGRLAETWLAQHEAGTAWPDACSGTGVI